MTENAAKPIRTLMLIDDEAVDQILYKRIIDRSGMAETVLQFNAADHALSFITSGDCPEIDAIILDINMPRMDGFEFLEALNQHPAKPLIKTIIVMITTSLDPRDKDRIHQYPAVKGLFDKPLTQEHLTIIAGYLEEFKG